MSDRVICKYKQMKVIQPSVWAGRDGYAHASSEGWK